MNRKFTARELSAEAQREVIQRQRVYARLVDQGKMRAADADRWLTMMRQIRDEYDEIAKKEEERGRLL